MTEDKMVGWHHEVNGHQLGQTPGDGEGQRGLACCSPWGHKESDLTEQLNKNNSRQRTHFLCSYLLGRLSSMQKDPFTNTALLFDRLEN